MATFGKISASTIFTYPTASDFAWGCKYTLTENGIASSIHILVADDIDHPLQPDTLIRMAIYRDDGAPHPNGGPDPGTLVAETNQQLVTVGENIIPISADLAPGDYWLMLKVNNGIYPFADQIPGTFLIWLPSLWGVFENPAQPRTSATDWQIAMWVTYNPATVPSGTLNCTAVAGATTQINAIVKNVYTQEVYGTTPFLKTLPVGTYNLEATWLGQTALDTVIIQENLETVITFQFTEPLTYNLSVSSIPIQGIAFTINGTSYTTDLLSTAFYAGTYTIIMPPNITVGIDYYRFSQWENASTNPMRTINLTAPTALTATYELYTRPPPVMPKLSTMGRNIVNEIGNIVLLRGVNKQMVHSDDWHPIPGIRGHGAFFGQYEIAIDSPAYTWDKYLDAHLNAMRDWGCNFLRLCIDLGWWMDNAYYNDAVKGSIPIRGMIEEVIRRANERGIYVLFDPHFPYNYAVPWDAGWFTRDQYVQVMIDVANYFYGWTGVLIDFYNEAHPYPDYTRWQSACQEILNAVRATGNDVIFLYQSDWSWFTIGGGPGAAKGTWAEQYPLTSPPTWTGPANIIYGIHQYRDASIAGYLTYDQITNYFWTQDELLIRYVLETLNLPVLVGEVGGYITFADDMTWLTNVLTFYNDKGISWAAWLWQGTSEGWGMQLIDILPTAPDAPPTATVAGSIIINSLGGLPLETWSIDISSTAGGTTSLTGLQTKYTTESVTVTAIPDTSFTLDHWEFDGSNIGSDPTVTIPPQTANSTHTLIAVFLEEIIPPPPPPPPCFIATVAYGSPFASELYMLRRFRNQCLPNPLVNAYYKIGAYLAQLIKGQKALKRYVREVLNLFVRLYGRG